MSVRKTLVELMLDCFEDYFLWKTIQKSAAHWGKQTGKNKLTEGQNLIELKNCFLNRIPQRGGQRNQTDGQLLGNVLNGYNINVNAAETVANQRHILVVQLHHYGAE